MSMAKMAETPISRRAFLAGSTCMTLAPCSFATRSQSTADGDLIRPNILWIIAEDTCPDLGCYGNRWVKTPHLDRLARQGIRYTNVFTTSPVCSASRSGFMTGMYQTSIGAHNHRSHRDDGYRLPRGVHVITDYLRDAGYFTANLKKVGDPRWGSGKNDFNFLVDKPFDGTHWSQRQPGQTFYAQVSFNEPKPGDWADNATLLAPKQRVNPAELTLPPYWPDHPVIREAFGNYLDAVTRLDSRVGFILNQLETDGLADNTIVFFFADHGQAMVRCKQWLYDGGIHIPLIVRLPGRGQAGTIRTDLVSAIDITATTLKLAGIKRPSNLEGQVFLGDERDPPREYVVAARDRCDETVDRIRCVRTKKFKYIRNFMPELPYTQLNRYVEQKFATMSVLRQLHAAGKLTPEQELFMASHRPAEELYDLQSDPHEVRNLSSSAQHSATLKQMRAILDQWIARTDDKGAIAEDSSVLKKWDDVMKERHPLPHNFETGRNQY